MDKLVRKALNYTEKNWNLKISCHFVQENIIFLQEFAKNCLLKIILGYTYLCVYILIDMYSPRADFLAQFYKYVIIFAIHVHLIYSIVN